MTITSNIWSVVWSMLIAALGAYTAFTHGERMRANTGYTATVWMLAGGSTLGMAIWSAHFLGMLALQLPTSVSLDLVLSALSLAVAVLTALLGFRVLQKPHFSTRHIMISGIMIGVGIVMAYHLGIASLRISFANTPLTALLPVPVAIASAWAALWLTYAPNELANGDWSRTVLGAIAMGMAISSIHCITLLGLHSAPISFSPADGVVIPAELMAVMLSLTVLIWFIGGLLASLFDQRMVREHALALAELMRKHQELRKHNEAVSKNMIAALRDSVAALRESEKRLRLTLQNAPDATLILEKHGQILFANDNFCTLLGHESDEIYEKTFFDLVPQDWHERFRAMIEYIVSEPGRHVYEIELQARNGEKIPLELTAALLPDGCIYASCRDIRDRLEKERHIHQLAFYDDLTGLPNRRLLRERAKKTLLASERMGLHGALMLLDLDNFKKLNDSKGHDLGDLLLCEVAQRLRQCVRKGDTVARLGGDEFVVVLENLSQYETEAAKQAEKVAEKIEAALSKPYPLQDYVHQTTCSIGVALFNGRHESLDGLLKHADIAMYQAKQAGRGAIRFYDPKMQAAVNERIEVEAAIDQALRSEQFRLYYQLQVNASEARRPVGAEVLIRWHHPQYGLVLPEKFIPVAEESKRILSIGNWVLKQACQQLKAWQHQTETRELTLAINVSARQFCDPGFVHQVKRTLLETGANPNRLKLELTENVVLGNVEEAIEKMHELKALGICLAIDDFGVGYSSLQYLRQLPLDQIKIDRSFICDLTTDSNDAAIVRAIVAMAKALGLDVIAEGVENAEQEFFLKMCGCHTYQGYLFGRPMPVQEFERALQGMRAAVPCCGSAS